MMIYRPRKGYTSQKYSFKIKIFRQISVLNILIQEFQNFVMCLMWFSRISPYTVLIWCHIFYFKLYCLAFLGFLSNVSSTQKSKIRTQKISDTKTVSQTNKNMMLSQINIYIIHIILVLKIQWQKKISKLWNVANQKPKHSVKVPPQ